MTPKELGYQMAAEWEKHSAVWLAWPNDETAFPNLMEKVEDDYCHIIKSLEESEKVNLIVLSEKKEKIKNKLENFDIDLKNINFITEEYNDVWVRDYAPTFLLDKNKKILGGVKWEYNGYGKSDDPYFAELLKDNEVFNKIEGCLGVQLFKPGIVLEGGAIEVNGNGVLMTTKQCLLNPNRNGTLPQDKIENYLKDHLGIEKIIWLENGLLNDHTDGHIDELARFVDPGTIVCAYEDNPDDENYKTLDDNFNVLKNSTDINDNKFNIIKMPMPHMQYDDGTKAPVSYMNFYIGNKVVLLPSFNDENDEKAKEIITQIFPSKEIIQINSTNLIYGGGGIHCITMQQPEI